MIMVLKRMLSSYWSVLVLVLLWQLSATVGSYNIIVMPSPADVFFALLDNPKFFVLETSYTLGFSLAGLFFGMGLGSLVAVLAWSTPIFEGVLSPIAIMVRSIPIIAFIPIIVSLFGYGSGTILASVTVLIFFPCYVFLLSGLKQVETPQRELSVILGSDSDIKGKWRFFYYLALPNAWPRLFTAFRILAPTSVLAVLVAEFLIGSNGLGYIISSARHQLDMGLSWLAALTATIISVGLFMTASRLEELIFERRFC